ncbi:MAG: hypothetical protein ACRC68_01550 [Clostridium sp.]
MGSGIGKMFGGDDVFKNLWWIDNLSSKKKKQGDNSGCLVSIAIFILICALIGIWQDGFVGKIFLIAVGLKLTGLLKPLMRVSIKIFLFISMYFKEKKWKKT